MNFFSSSSNESSKHDRIDDLVGLFAPKKQSMGEKIFSILSFQSAKPQAKESSEVIDEEQGGLLGAFKYNIGEGLSKSSNYISGLRNKMQDVQSAAENWKSFSVLFFLGILFLFLSFIFLPVFVLFPSKFASLFTLGSMCILGSVAVLKGYSQFFKLIIQKEKIYYTICYAFAMIGTLYVSIVKKAYILTLLFSIAQIFALAFFVSTSFPGGTNGMKYISKKIFGMIKGFCCMCFKQDGYANISL